MLILFQIIFAGIVSAQGNADSAKIPKPDTLPEVHTVINKDSLPAAQITDSVSKRPKHDSAWLMNPEISFSVQEFNRQVLQRHPYFGFRSAPVNIYSVRKEFKGKELLFYMLIFLLLFFAFLKKIFPKYFNDLFRLFFRTTLKQRQIREQLMQTPQPSLLFNCFFILTAALYVDFLLQHFDLRPVNNFWLLFLYCGFGFCSIYLVRFLGLKLSGWIFNMQEVTDAYIFIVFIVNKMIGIFLLPFLIVLAFSDGYIYSIFLTISWCGVGALLIYRFILSYSAVRNQIKVNPFHFFLYLCAFEIAPLLLIYKALLYFFE
ncbi:MAG: DUF4271 domain-containing protein [Chitinophagales bacterium]